eukprot:5154069-Prymnesium_polylepis.1
MMRYSTLEPKPTSGSVRTKYGIVAAPHPLAERGNCCAVSASRNARAAAAGRSVSMLRARLLSAGVYHIATGP